MKELNFRDYTIGPREQRKIEHINLALEQYKNQNSVFEDLKIIHHSFPEINWEDTSLHSKIGNLEVETPIIINAMTGGAKISKSINEKLATVARETGISMAVGSQKAAIRNKNVRKTYEIVREINPTGIILANISADSTLDEARQAIEMVQANILQLHINVPQEIVMPEGDRNFLGILDNIYKIRCEIDIPIIVKEVGFGMCLDTYKLLLECGINCIDVGGSGGTNFIKIENNRRLHSDYDFMYSWGQSTLISLLEAQPIIEQLNLISSGGIRNPLDMIKSFILGASAVGIASKFLKYIVENGVEETIKMVEDWKKKLRDIMTILGVKTIRELTNCPVIVTGESKNWCELRGIDLSKLANKRIKRH